MEVTRASPEERTGLCVAGVGAAACVGDPRIPRPQHAPDKAGPVHTQCTVWGVGLGPGHVLAKVTVLDSGLRPAGGRSPHRSSEESRRDTVHRWDTPPSRRRCRGCWKENASQGFC